MNQKTAIFEYSMVFMVFFVACSLRLYGLENRGLIYHDEGYYANAAKTPHYVFKWFTEDKELNPDISLSNYLQKFGCSNPVEKPGHIFLISHAFLVFGVSELVPLLSNAMWGICCIVLMFFFCRKRFGFTWTVFSTALLSVSFLHMHYSRSLLYVSGVFFSLLALHFYLLSWEKDCANRHKWLIIVGVLLGYAISIDQKILFYAGCIGLTEIYVNLYIHRSKITEIFKKCSVLLGGFALVSIIIELCFHVLYKISNLGTEKLTYFGQFFQRKINAIADSYTTDFTDLFFYPKMLFQIEGTPFTILLFCGLILFFIALIRNKKPIYFFSLLLWLFTLTFWTFRSGGHPSLKVLPTLLPTGAIIAGYPLSKTYEYFASNFKGLFPKVYLLVTLVAILIFGTVRAIPLMSTNNIYCEAVSAVCDEIRKNKTQIVISQQGSFSPIARFYFGLKVEKDISLSDHVIFEPLSVKRNDYLFASWHNYGKQKNLTNLLQYSTAAVELFKWPDTSVQGIPELCYYLRGGSVLQEYVLAPAEKYPNFRNLIVYSSASQCNDKPTACQDYSQ